MCFGFLIAFSDRFMFNDSCLRSDDYANMHSHTQHNPLHPERWFYLFLFVHLLGWTLAPVLIRYNLPLDAIEGTIWGHQLEWGYDKNPYLNGWLTALAVRLGGESGWMVYLFSQLSVVVCFWAVWQLAKHLFPSKIYALISVLLLEGIQYYHFHAIDFNDNTLELGLWALAIFYFYQALSKPTYRAWILTGIFSGLGVMAKYYTLALLSGMFLFLLILPTNRRQLATSLPYVGLLGFLLVSMPHVVWLFSHDFITITYVFMRASSPPSWTNHFFFPAQFFWQQFEVLIPALILFACLFIGKKPFAASKQIKLTSFDKQFLFYVGLAPLILTLLLSLLCGTNLRAGWGMPLLSLSGIMLVAWFPPNLTRKKLYCFILAIFTLMSILLTGYSFSLIHATSTSSANFPGQEIASVVTKIWHDHCHTRLDYVAGSRWVGGNIAFYSSDHPAVFIEWNQQHAPWIDQEKLKEKGAIFVWDITANESIPTDIQKHFPLLNKPMQLEFDWRRNQHHLPPVKIGVAILPPATPVSLN